MTRTARAQAAVANASTATTDEMRHHGWHPSTAVVDEHAALEAVEDQLADRDYQVAVTRTCAGYIVWTAQKD